MAKQSVSWPWKQKVNEHINNMHACNSVNMENTDYRKDNLANLVFNWINTSLGSACDSCSNTTSFQSTSQHSQSFGFFNKKTNIKSTENKSERKKTGCNL